MDGGRKIKPVDKPGFDVWYFLENYSAAKLDRELEDGRWRSGFHVFDKLPV